MAFSSGRKALAICDRCGMAYPYPEIRAEWNRARVCPECWESKHPQLDPPDVKADDEALRYARPDRTEPVPDTSAYDDLLNNPSGK